MIVWRRLRNNWRNAKINKIELFCSKRGKKAPLLMKKEGKNAFFLKNIWSVKKNVVPLHRFSADV